MNLEQWKCLLNAWYRHNSLLASSSFNFYIEVTLELPNICAVGRRQNFPGYKKIYTCISFTIRRLTRRTSIIALSLLLFFKWKCFWFIFHMWKNLKRCNLEISEQRKRDFILHFTQTELINQRLFYWCVSPYSGWVFGGLVTDGAEPERPPP